MQGKNNGEKKTEDSSCSLLWHFWSTSWSPFSTCYIPFQSSGSQESNALNRVRFGAEMRKIWPSEDNCIKPCENFARWISPCEISQGDFPHGAKFRHFATLRNFARRNSPCKNAKFPLFLHARTTDFLDIFSLIFSRVNSFCNLVFSRHKALSCNFAIYKGAQRLQKDIYNLGDRSSVH